MPQELQLKHFEQKEGQKYKVIQITDVMLHTSKHRPTNPVKALKNTQNGEPGRIYSPLTKSQGSDDNLVMELLKLDPELAKYVQEQEALGYKVLIQIPKEGIPMLAGKDTIDFIKSTKGKRILRWIDKSRQEE